MVNGGVVKFNYPVVIPGNYRYKGVVENHDYLGDSDGTKSQIGLESTWVTTWWTI